MLGHWSLSFSIHLAVAGLVFTSRFFRSQEKVIIGEKRNDLVLQPRRAELRRRKSLSKK